MKKNIEQQVRKFVKNDKQEATASVNTVTPTKNSDIIVNVAKETKALAISTAASAEKIRASIKISKDVVKTILENPSDIKPSGEVRATEINNSTINEINNREISANVDKATLTTNDVKIVDATIETSSRTSSELFSKRNSLAIDKNQAIPSIEMIEVALKKNKGCVDGFYTKIHFSVAASDIGKLKAFRVFRSETFEKSLLRDYGSITSQGISRIATQTGRKNNETFQMHEKRLIEKGIKNDITTQLKIDQFTGLRTSYIDSAMSGTVNETKVNAKDDIVRDTSAKSYVKRSIGTKLDRSVVDSPNAIKNIISQDPSLKINIFEEKQTVTVIGGKRDYQKPVQAATTSRVNSSLVNEKNNSVNFKELMFLSIDKMRSKRNEQNIEFEVEDASVLYGITYRYYITSIDYQMNDSQRSKLMIVPIERNIPPSPPTLSAAAQQTSVTLLCASSDEFIERYEVFRKTLSLDSSDSDTVEFTSLSGDNGITKTRSSKKLSNGFIQIGETIASKDASSPLIDKNVIPGRNYLYRVYSIDIFGNKSQEYSETTAFIKERSSRQNDLKKPTILVELDSKTGFINVRLTNDDDRIKALFLSRKDLTLREKSFHNPSFGSHIKLGTSGLTRQKSNSDVVLSDDKAAWSGYFPIPKQGKDIVQFTDRLTRFDKTYQYSVYGVDRFGNRTPPAISSIIFVSRDPRIEAPINITSKLEASEGASQPDKVRISWEDTNLDVNPLELIGNRKTLEENKVRTLFQVQRKALGQEIWEQFPLNENKFFIDNIVDNNVVYKRAPSYRPPYLIRGQTYQYRVATFQSGSFISDYSLPVTISTEAGIKPPVSVTVKSIDTRLAPFYVTLNWAKDQSSGAVDAWEIERVGVNNIAAKSIDAKNIKELEKLNFKRRALVGNEASRALPVTLDDVGNTQRNDVFFGEKYFIDHDVLFGNTYFYRIRAVGADKSLSAWEYRGVSITDANTDKRLATSLTQKEIDNLIKTKNLLTFRKTK